MMNIPHNEIFRLHFITLRSLMESPEQDRLHSISDFGGLQAILDGINTDPDKGLSGDDMDLSKRKRHFGSNVIPPIKSVSFLRLLKEASHDITLMVLAACGVVSVILWPVLMFGFGGASEMQESKDDWIDGLSTLGSVIIIILITACNDFFREKKFRHLQERLESGHTSTVWRAGRMIEVLISDMVVGDICQIKSGDKIPTDGILITSHDLEVDESSLTAEGDIQSKRVNEDPMLFSGTFVVEGCGKYVVTAVGRNTQYSRMLYGNHDDELTGYAVDTEELSNRTRNEKLALCCTSRPARTSRGTIANIRLNMISKKSPKLDKDGKSVLQLKLTRIATRIGYIGFAISSISFLALVIRFVLINYFIREMPFQVWDVSHYLRFLTTAICILVVAVPEGLPLTVTLALAYSVKNMVNDNNLVRHISSCETMGYATAICVEKTGTLTSNRMEVVRSFICGQIYHRTPRRTELPDRVMQLLLQTAAHNTSPKSCVIVSRRIGDSPKMFGNITECALMAFVLDLGMDYEAERNRLSANQFISLFEFTSFRNFRSTVIPKPDGSFRVLCHGCAEVLLERCTEIIGTGGSIQEFQEDKKQTLYEKIIKPMTKESLRIICVAYRELDGKQPDWDDEVSIVRKLVCVCILGIENPVRDEVPQAIRLCQSAGICVRMFTGDNIETAKAVAFNCGILKRDQEGSVMDGDTFRMRIQDSYGCANQELIDKVWPDLRVLARCNPQDVHSLVQGIMRSRINNKTEVVVVTGSRANDSENLRCADVGIAMGICGTDTVREASDIVVTDDNFDSIVKALMWGRNVEDSVVKFLQFQLTVSLVGSISVVTIICASDYGPPKGVLLLWMNLIMDTFASLALSTDHPSSQILLRKPCDRTKSLFSRGVIKYVFFMSVYQLTIMLFLLFQGPNFLDVDDGMKFYEPKSSPHLTVVTNSFFLMTLFNQINARKLHGQRHVFSGLLKNRIFIAIFCFVLAFQILIVNFVPMLFHLHPLTLEQWMWCLTFGVGTLLWFQLILTFPTKWIPDIFNKQFRAKKNTNNRIESQAKSRDNPISESIIDFALTEDSNDDADLDERVECAESKRRSSKENVCMGISEGAKSVNKDGINSLNPKAKRSRPKSRSSASSRISTQKFSKSVDDDSYADRGSTDARKRSKSKRKRTASARYSAYRSKSNAEAEAGSDRKKSSNSRKKKKVEKE